MKLTKREREAVAWAAHGLTISVIAVNMRCSYRTVQDHLKHARAKMKAANQANLVFLVYKELRDDAD